MIFIHISNVVKISHFVVIHFLVIRTNFAYALTAYVSYAKNATIDRHWLNLNQSKTNCSKNLNSDRMIVREMGPWPECSFSSSVQFLVMIIFVWQICKRNGCWRWLQLFTLYMPNFPSVYMHAHLQRVPKPRHGAFYALTMMTSSNGNIFRATGHLCGEFTGPRWIPRTKASDAELWCFLWSASE